MLQACTVLDEITSNSMPLQARAILDDILRDRVVGVLALVTYTDGRVKCVRMGQVPPAVTIATP